MLELTGAALIPISGIYEIRNIHTGQCYIGQSKSIPSRWATHFAQLGTGRHTLRAFQRDWTQYGPDAFKASIVKVVDDATALLAEEAAIAREYINSGTKLYNASIDGWINEDELAVRLAHAREAAKQEEAVLQRKRANQHESRNQRGGNSRNPVSVRAERGIQGDGRLFGDSTGSPVEGDQRGICEPQAGLFAGKQGIDTETGTERPTPPRLDENRQRRESYQDDREILPIFDSYAAEVLTEHLPEEERERYLQDLISDTLYVSGGTAIDLALIIQAAFCKEDVIEAWHVLDPNTVSVFFSLDDDEFEFARAVADSHPDGRAAWVMKQARAGK